MRERLQQEQRRQTAYEWDFEQIDEHGDIVDHNHSDTLLKSGFEPDFERDRFELVLVRDSGCEADGLDDRQWAYATLDDNGLWTLPSHFDGGALVPKRFFAELARWQKAQPEAVRRSIYG